MQLLLFLPCHVVDDVTLVHHDQAVAVFDGILHVVGDHHGGQVVFLHDACREGKHLQRRFGVQCGSVLVQQQELGFVHGSHQQGQRLPLTAGKQPHAGGQAILKAQIKGLEQLAVLLPLSLGDADAQGAALAAPGCQRQIFLDLHSGSSAGHGVLEHAANVGGALMFTQAGDVHTVDQNFALVHRPYTGNGIQHSGFTRTVAADHGNKIPLVQLQVQAVQGGFLVHRACIEGFGNILDLKHFLRPPLPF